MNNLTERLENTHIHDNVTSTVAPGRTPKDLAEADSLIRTLHSFAESKIKGAKRGRNLVYGNLYELDLLQERPPIKISFTNNTSVTDDAEGAATATTTTEEKDKSHVLEVTSWKMNEFEYSSGALPSLARGLFTYLNTTTEPSKAPVTSTPTTTTSSSSSKNRRGNRNYAAPVAPNVEEPAPVLTGKDAVGTYRILLRGYDKFFNVGEVPKTSTEWIAENTEGPYEVTLKENGCIIFMSGLPPHLVGPEGGCIVTSKHSLGHADPETGMQVEATHAGKGREWLEKGLAARGKTVQEFGRWLWDHNLTAVAELCDDSFEEHILEYPIEKSGLYVHGLNRNTVDFQTLPSNKVQEFAREWGLRVTDYVTLNTHQEVMDFADKVRNAGEYDNRAVEGFVVRSKVKGDGTTHFFKIKYDEPYLMYREWREITKRLWGIQSKETAEIAKTKAKLAAEKERAAAMAHYTPKKVESLPKEVAPVEEFKVRMRYPLTKHYVEFVKDLIKTQPELFVGYNKNQGIIAIRDMFLEYWESKTVQEKDKLITGAVSGKTSGSKTEDDFQRTVIIPIATIGCGKTTVSVALTKLFGWGHISSDDYHHYRKTSGQQFMKAVVKSLKDHTVVIADRNNHEYSHRQRIMETVKAVYPKTRFVALYWSHEETPINTVREMEIERVKNRGSNHQSMTPEFCPEYEFIIQRFLRTFEPLNPMVAPDSGFSYVIENRPGEESLAIVDRVIKEFAIPTLGAGGVGNHAIPKPEEVKEAVRFSLEDWKPIRVTNGEAAKFHNQQKVKQVVKSESSSSPVAETVTPTEAKNGSSAAVTSTALAMGPVVTSAAKGKKIKEPNYFGIAIDTGAVLRFLTEQFESKQLSGQAPSNGQTTTMTAVTSDKALWAQLYEQFKTWQETNRVGARQHVTLIHTTARKDTSPKRAQRAQEIWKLYSDEMGLEVKTPGSTVPNSPVVTPPALPVEDEGFTKVGKGARNQRQGRRNNSTPAVSPPIAVSSGTASPTLVHQTTPESPLSLASLSISEDSDLDATVTADFIVWTERIMILRVNKANRTKSGKPFENTQATLHVTVGTAGDLVKPFESNEVLRRWGSTRSAKVVEGGVKEGPDIFAIKLETPVVLTGFLKPMWF
ncbi:MAG: RNA ligase-domain-containing protein [Linnemannia gamsii]|nr:MAG: RNA ligase-domain-containing protein [Linnemannia gamsii]